MLRDRFVLFERRLVLGAGYAYASSGVEPVEPHPGSRSDLHVEHNWHLSE